MSDDFLIPPPVGSGETPALFKLGGLKFQALCRDLLDNDGDPQIGSCSEYGKNGESQHGVDLIGDRHDGGIDAIQCKGQERFPPQDIRDASKEFLQHVTLWKERGVRRFLVLVGCEVKSVKQRKEIEAQRRTFQQQYGMAYELWESPKIVNKLRPHAGIVRQHLGGGWVAFICDQPTVAVRIESTQFTISSELTSFLTDATDSRLNSIREDWRQGYRKKARHDLLATKANTVVWNVLPARTQAAFLRFEASIVLDDEDDPDRATKLLDEAQLLDHTPDDARLRAAILWHHGQPEEALSLLATPTTTKLRHFKALLLIHSDRAPEALDLLTSVAQPDSETFHLMSLTHIASGRIGEARLAIQKAREQSPLWVNVQLVSATLDYFSALTPTVIPRSIPSWPEPVHSTFMLQDVEARRNLQRAHDQFTRILMTADLNADERLCVETWIVASLVLNPETRDQFEAEAKRLLSITPTHHRVMAWAIVGGLKDLTKRPAEAIRQLVIDGRAELEQILTLVQFHVADHRFEKAATLLDQAESQFAEDRARRIWLGWRAQVEARLGHLEKAIQLAKSIGDEAASRLLQARLLVTSEGTDPANVRIFLQDAYSATGDPRFLLDLVEEDARAGRWILAADRCEELFSKMPTTEVHRLAAFSAYHVQRYSLCMRLLNEGQPLYAGRLPSELREMRVDCQARLGLLPAGLREAELLAEEEPTLEHLLGLARLYFSIGDTRSLSTVARRILPISSASADVFLRLAGQVRWEDRTLAIDLWRAAQLRGLRDELVTTALQLGFDLGLDKSLHELTVRMQLLGQASQAGVKMATIDDLLKHMEAFREESQRLNQAYQSATIPIHYIAPRLNLTLAQIYHSQLEENTAATNLGTAPSVFVRGGNRYLPPIAEVTKDSFRVFADITAILTAHHYGFLGAVEQTFSPIHISPLLIPSLLEMRDRLSSGQTQRFKAHEEILAFHLRGSLAKHTSTKATRQDLPSQIDPSWVALVKSASLENGYVVDYLPLITGGDRVDPSILPNEVREVVVGIGSVIRSLFTFGALTIDRRDELLQTTSLHGEPLSAEPREGAKIYFHGTAIEFFAAAGLLDTLAAHFKVLVEDTELARLQVEVEANRQRQQLAIWLADLVVHLNAGIVGGRYTAVSTETLEPVEENEREERNLAAEALLTLVRIKGQESGRAWIDDRFGNRHRSMGVMPTIDSMELLQQLVAHGNVSESAYYETVTRMRAEGAMFLPVNSEEVLHHVLSASFSGNAGETTGLRMLRRGIAASLLATRFLRSSVGDGGLGDSGEYPFLLRTTSAISQTCCRLWCNAELSQDDAQRRAEWILNHLFVPLYAARKLPTTLPEGHDPSIFAVNAASLFSQGMDVIIEQDGRRRARSYNEWLYRSLFRRRFLLDPKLLQQTAAYVKQLMGSFEARGHTDSERRASVMAAGSYYLSMPVAIQNIVAQDPEFLRKYGVQVLARILVGKLEFDRDAYFAAAGEAINGREGSAVVHSLKDPVRFLPSQNGEGITLNHPSFSLPVLIEDWRLLLLAESPSRREHAIELARDLLDVPYRLQDSLSEVASTEDFLRRLEKAEALRDASLLMFYEQLAEKLDAHSSFSDLDFFPAERMALLRHLRLDESASFTEAGTWSDDAIDDMRRSLSLVDQLHRLFRLPIELPADVLRDVRGLSTPKKHALIHTLLGKYGGPLWRIQFEKMSHACLSTDEQIVCLWEPAATERTNECNVYLSVVRWVYDQLIALKEQLRWSTPAILAVSWSHGDRLFSILQEYGVSMDWIEDHFSTSSIRVASLLLDGHLSSSTNSDVANPHNVTPEVLWACGFRQLADESGKVRTLLRIDKGTAAIPHPTLFPPVVSVPNDLSSFLGCDRLESFLRHTENQSETPHTVRTEFEQLAIKMLTEGNNDGWYYVHCFVGSLTVPETCAETVRTAMRSWNFVEAGEGKQLEHTARALYTAALLLRWANDSDATTHITSQFVSVLRETKAHASADRRSFVGFLLEIALLLAQSEDSSEKRVGRFCALVGSIVAELPQSGRIIRPMVQALCDELPIGVTAEVWRLNLQLRAH